MNIINETELMANQKASAVLAPDLEFEALQTTAGNALVFAIDSNHVFNCTAETPGDTHGWVQVNLNTIISNQDFGGQSIVAKTFDVGQDPATGAVDIALVVTADNQDWLYLSLNNTATDWSTYAPRFQKIAFDDPDNAKYAFDPFNDVIVASYGNNQFIFVDIITDPVAQTLTRYAIDPSQGVTGSFWIQHGLPVSAQAGPVTSIVGCGPVDQGTNGVYTLCTVGSNAQLVYAPLFNQGDPGGAPPTTDFDLTKVSVDVNHMAMALSVAKAPFTDLFFASNGALYFAPNAAQIEVNDVLPTLTQIYTHDLFQNIQSLTVNNWNGNIVLWGQSVNPDAPTTSLLFVMECVAGQETNINAWSIPVPILFNVEDSASFIHNKYSTTNSISGEGNAYGSCSVIFAHTTDNGGELVQLFQDPITTAWQERYLLSEPLDANAVPPYETTSYTSHIRITDVNNMVVPYIPVSIWASSPCSVYVNNVYSQLSFDGPLQTTADESGIVNIMQPVDTIGGICYNIAVQDPTSKQWYSEVINPIAVTNAAIAKQVPDGTGNHVNVNVTDEMGKSTPLISDPSVSGDTDAQTTASNNIYSFSQQNSKVNADGLTADQGSWPTPGVSAVQAVQGVQAVQKVAKLGRQGKHMRFDPNKNQIWGCTFGENSKHYQGIEAMKEMGVTLNADNSLSITTKNGVVLSGSNWLEAKAGHLFKWMKSEAHKLVKLVVQVGEDGLDCLMTIGDDIYHCLVKCLNDIANAIHTALNAIKTAFADLVKWIGSIFAWSDFISTHKMIKKLFVLYSDYAIKGIDNYKTAITGFGDKVIAQMDGWANVPSEGPQSQSADPANNTSSGQHSPQSNWGHHHMKNNASNTTVALASNDCSSSLQTLITAIENEGDIFIETVEQLGDIFENIENLTVLELLQQVSVTFATGILLSIENVLIAFLNLVEIAVKDMMDELQSNTLKIPVISTLYERFVGSPLTLLDLMCLICAIPTTVMYKLANKGAAPFPDDDQDTIDLLGATDFESFSALCVDNPTVATLQTTSGPAGDTVLVPELNDRWYKLFFAGNVMAFAGGGAISILTAAKALSPTLAESKVVGWLGAIFYMPYIGPDIVGNIPGIACTSGIDMWYGIMNAACAGLGLLKALYDARVTGSPQNNNGVPPAPDDPGTLKSGKTGYAFVGPVLDAILGFAWEFPVVFAYINSKHWKNDIIDIAANTAFNITGPLSLVINFAKGPAQAIGVISSCVLNSAYGILSIAESLDGQPIDPINP